MAFQSPKCRSDKYIKYLLFTCLSSSGTKTPAGVALRTLKTAELCHFWLNSGAACFTLFQAVPPKSRAWSGAYVSAHGAVCQMCSPADDVCQAGKHLAVRPISQAAKKPAMRMVSAEQAEQGQSPNVRFQSESNRRRPWRRHAAMLCDPQTLIVLFRPAHRRAATR